MIGRWSIGMMASDAGVKAEGEGVWNARKHNGTKRRIWCKTHIGFDKETLEKRAVEITISNVGDATMLLEMPTRAGHWSSFRRRRLWPLTMAVRMPVRWLCGSILLSLQVLISDTRMAQFCAPAS